MSEKAANLTANRSISHVFDCTFDPCRCLEPEIILITRTGTLWEFSIGLRNGTLFDHSLSSSRWLCWRMAKTSWRTAAREYKREAAAEARHR